MNPAKLTLAALLATAPAAFGQNPTRVITEISFDSESVALGGTVASDYNGAQAGAHAGADVGSGAADPGLAGVTLIAVDVDVHVTADLVVEFFGLNPNGTIVGGSDHRAFWSCGGACYWGPFDSAAWLDDFGSNNPIALGEARTFTTTVDQSGGAHHAPGNGPWGLVLASSYIDTGVSVALSNWYAYDPVTSQLVDIAMLSLTVDAMATQTYVTTLELSPTPMANYCTSQANGLNVHGALEAYGSPEPTISGEWLTIRTRDVPEGSAGILFMGTDIVVVPGGTTTLCVGGNIQRVGGVQVVNGGHADFEVSLASFLPGDTARFQCFHRDPAVGVAATDAFALTVQ